MFRKTRSLKLCISLILTVVSASVALVFSAMWLHNVRDSVREEVEAANKVTIQWLEVLEKEHKNKPAAWPEQRLLSHLTSLGRLRANELQIFSLKNGQLVYKSPRSSYKKGRSAPKWFLELASPDFYEQRVWIGSLVILLIPEPSRTILDFWDDLATLIALVISLLLAIFVLSWIVLARLLNPLGDAVNAFQKADLGSLDTRLPDYALQEFKHLAYSFNTMLERLDVALKKNVRLEIDQDHARNIQADLEAERRALARELHDEVAQGTTAISLMAASLQNQLKDDGIKDGSQKEREMLVNGVAHIVEATGGLQENVYNLLEHLRTPVTKLSGKEEVSSRLENWLKVWQKRHSDIELKLSLQSVGSIDSDCSQAALRIVQESLTNVLRHARATQIEIELQQVIQNSKSYLEVVIRDNGQGLEASAKGRSSFGLLGIHERSMALGGYSEVNNLSTGGVVVRACLPLSKDTA